MGWIGPLLLLIGVGVLGAVRGANAPGDLDWQPDLASARQLALHTHQPLLLMFYTQGCVWCGKMEAETFADSNVVALSKRFVCVRIDGEMASDLCSQYRVNTYPTTVFLDWQGRSLGKLPDYASPASFSDAQRRVLQASK